MAKRRILTGDANEIVRQMKIAEKTSYYRKLQCVYLALIYPEITAAQIGKITLYSTSRVWAIHAAYREEGISGLVDERGGRYRQNMTVEEEAELLERFKEESESGHVVVAGKIKLAYEAKVGREVAESTIYRMLGRHGFRKIIPSKKHPKASKEEQEAFKKFLQR